MEALMKNLYLVIHPFLGFDETLKLHCISLVSEHDSFSVFCALPYSNPLMMITPTSESKITLEKKHLKQPTFSGITYLSYVTYCLVLHSAVTVFCIKSREHKIASADSQELIFPVLGLTLTRQSAVCLSCHSWLQKLLAGRFSCMFGHW